MEPSICLVVLRVRCACVCVWVSVCVCVFAECAHILKMCSICVWCDERCMSPPHIVRACVFAPYIVCRGHSAGCVFGNLSNPPQLHDLFPTNASKSMWSKVWQRPQAQFARVLSPNVQLAQCRDITCRCARTARRAACTCRSKRDELPCTRKHSEAISERDRPAAAPRCSSAVPMRFVRIASFSMPHARSSCAS